MREKARSLSEIPPHSIISDVNDIDFTMDESNKTPIKRINKAHNIQDIVDRPSSSYTNVEEIIVESDGEDHYDDAELLVRNYDYSLRSPQFRLMGILNFDESCRLKVLMKVPIHQVLQIFSNKVTTTNIDHKFYEADFYEIMDKLLGQLETETKNYPTIVNKLFQYADDEANYLKSSVRYKLYKPNELNRLIFENNVEYKKTMTREQW